MVHEVGRLKARPTVPGSMGAIATQQRRIVKLLLKETDSLERLFSKEEP
jgi:hypothetical protein